MSGWILTLWIGAALAQRPALAELATLRVPPEMRIDLFASEPMIQNPSAVDVDSKGRVWVAEIQWYRSKAKTPPADKIKVLEDTDGDGKADKSTVFYDGLFCPMSVCVAGDRVYVATSPDLWVFEDKDGDLRADGPPKKVLTGFGGVNHDHGAHSLVLGPDHCWYMSHGDGGFDLKGTDGSKIKYRWGAMLRGELDGSKLQIVARNFRNPYELCVNSFGEIFCSDNDNDGNQSVRICWIMEGGDYGWFGSPPGRVPTGTPFGEHWHFRGHLPGFVPATLVTGFGSPCGICFYEGNAFGPRYKNLPWHADAGPREVRTYRHVPAGFGMKATSEVVVSTTGDPYFRPDDVCTGPAGEIYLADWYDGGVGGHGYNDPDRGRIFLMRPKTPPQTKSIPSGPFATPEQALEGLASPNLATQYLARQKLLSQPEKFTPAVADTLRKSSDENLRARSLWLLDRMGWPGRQFVVEQLRAQDPAFRALAVRILRRHGKEYEALLLAMAVDEAAEVRREVLLAIASMDDSASMEALARIAATYDGADRYQLEAIHIAAGSRKKELFAKLRGNAEGTSTPLDLLQVLDPKAAATLLVDRLSRLDVGESAQAALLEAAGRLPSMDAADAVLKLAESPGVSPELRRRALAIFAENLGGVWKPMLDAPAALQSRLRPLLENPLTQGATLQLVADHRIKALAPDVWRLAENRKAEASARTAALQAGLRMDRGGAVGVYRKLLNDSDATVRRTSIQGLVDLQDVRTVKEWLADGRPGAAAVQAAALDRLFATVAGALFLSRMIERDQCPPALKDRVLDRGASHPDANVRAAFERFVPPEKRPKRLGDAVKPEEILSLPGDAARGERIFAQSTAANCKTCHLIAGVGGKVGPDLSRIGLKYERRALLETILEPSKAVANEYLPYLIETKSGELFVGLIADKNDEQTTLRDARGELLRIPASEIASVSPQTKSLMPELVLRDVSPQDAADLLAYLAKMMDAVAPVGRAKLVGPFDADGEKALELAFPPEERSSKPDFSASYPGRGDAKLKWREQTAADSAAGVVFALPLGRGTAKHGAVFYLAAKVESPADQSAKLLVRSDGPVKIWLNGESSVVASPAAIDAAPSAVPIHLKSGANVLFVKSLQKAEPARISLAVQSRSDVRISVE